MILRDRRALPKNASGGYQPERVVDVDGDEYEYEDGGRPYRGPKG